jgi:hypothetical protein
VLTRRAALAIVTMALMVLASLRYASYRAHEEEIAKRRRKKMISEGTSMQSEPVANLAQRDVAEVGAAEVLAAN